ncbi:hypothetical protein HNR31_002224 [Anoxybacillus caldiproteolyticus]|uniref:Uncharacterized protein n=1 Tax=Thermaerobacillus caldiproteolyticus TaxID=247480 RepID=A0A7W0BY88_9BACL|nr:hypothetical protein [Anoxybacillus caldiproteolyticus]
MAEEKLMKELLMGAGSCKEAEKMLVNIRGIGPWAANYVLMRCLRMPSSCTTPLNTFWAPRTNSSKEEILKSFSRWTNRKTHATFLFVEIPLLILGISPSHWTASLNKSKSFCKNFNVIFVI